MTISNFDAALVHVLRHEGGYSNHPDDPGGATNKGITQVVYDAYRKRLRQNPRSVREITETEFRDIYRSQYWEVLRADDLPRGLDYVVFDGGVNSGTAQSAKWLQRAVNDIRKGQGLAPIAVDGVIGTITLHAIEELAEDERLVELICERRLTFLKTLKTWTIFGKGWQRRVADVRAQGLAWTGVVDSPPLPAERTLSETSNARGTLASAPALPGSNAPTGTAAGGIIAGTMAEAARQIAPMTSSSKLLAAMFVIFTVVGVLAIIGGLVWAQWQKRQRDHLIEALDLVPQSTIHGATS